MKYSPAMAPGRMLKISMVSVNADPLAPVGCSAAGAQNLHVDELSAALVRAGHDVTVFTRRAHVGGPDRVRARAGYSVDYLEAGPTQALPDADILPHLGTFASILRAQWSTDRPDVVHSHFWMSGVATELATRSLGIPRTSDIPFPGICGAPPPRSSRRQPPLGADSPGTVDRQGRNPCHRDQFGRNLRSGPAGITTITDHDGALGRGHRSIHPGGTRREENRTASIDLRRKTGGAEGFDVAVAALASLPDTELVVIGGPPVAQLSTDEVAIRLVKLAERLGVADRVQLLGRVPHRQLPKLMRSADALVCTPSIRTVRNRGAGSNGVRSSRSRDSCWRTAGYGDRRTHRASGPGQQPGGNRARSPPSSRRRGRRRGVCTAEPGPSVRIVFVGSRRHRSGPHLRPLRHSTAESPPTQGTHRSEVH